jgi:carbonic anhydrase
MIYSISRSTASKLLSLSLLAFSVTGLHACNALPNDIAGSTIESPTSQTPAETHDDDNTAEAHEDVHFSYAGENGPEHWGALSAEFEKCGSGTVQSPINIKSVNVAPIAFDYKEVALTELNNGHTLQINYPAGSSIMIGEQKFELLQFHFHTPSENTLDGKAFDMEMHLVHKDANGHLGVIGVFFEKGEENPTLKTILEHLPKAENEPETFADMHINAASLLPKNATYYGFEGSLTTPPCSEGVEWRVMSEPLQMSEAQLASFMTILHNNNARPVQPLNGREVKISQ